MAIENFKGQPNSTDILPYLVGEVIDYAFQQGRNIIFVFRSGCGFTWNPTGESYNKMSKEQALIALNTRRQSLEKVLAQHGEFWPPDVTAAAREEAHEDEPHDRFERKDPL